MTDAEKVTAWVAARNGAQRKAIAEHFGWPPVKTDSIIREAGLEAVRTSPRVEVVYISAHAAKIRATLAHVDEELVRINRRIAKARPVTSGARSVFDLAGQA